MCWTLFTHIPGAFRTEPHPHLRYSNHISVMLILAYRQLVRRSKAVLKQVKKWPAGAISALQDCFEHTDWHMFRAAATTGDSTKLGGIHKVYDIIDSKTITTRSNQTLWITVGVYSEVLPSELATRQH